MDEKVDDLLSHGVRSAPDMHSEVCAPKEAEQSDADEEEWVTPVVTTSTRGRAQDVSVSYRALRRPPVRPHPLALASMRPVHFDPLPIFLGPKPGWADVLAAASPPPAAPPRSNSSPPTTTGGADAPLTNLQSGDKAPPSEVIARMVPLSAVAQPNASIGIQPAASINSETLAQPTATKEPQSPGRIQLRQQGGVFIIPVTVNSAIRLNFILDSGSADVSVPADVVLTLMRTGTISSSDFVGQQTYKLADGSTVPSVTFIIRSLKIGNREIQNVTASVTGVEGSLLLGQTFLSRFKSWSIDNQHEMLVFN